MKLHRGSHSPFVRAPDGVFKRPDGDPVNPDHVGRVRKPALEGLALWRPSPQADFCK